MNRKYDDLVEEARKRVRENAILCPIVRDAIEGWKKRKAEAPDGDRDYRTVFCIDIYDAVMNGACPTPSEGIEGWEMVFTGMNSTRDFEIKVVAFLPRSDDHPLEIREVLIVGE